MFGFNALAVGHGFLVPGHATGGLSIINLDDLSVAPATISVDLDNWFYHKAFARDMDGDGDLDFVTARCRDNVIPFPWNPPNMGMLIWLENPGGDNPLGQRWEEHEMMEGPDFLIDMRDEGETGKPFEVRVRGAKRSETTSEAGRKREDAYFAGQNPVNIRSASLLRSLRLPSSLT